MGSLMVPICSFCSLFTTTSTVLHAESLSLDNVHSNTISHRNMLLLNQEDEEVEDRKSKNGNVVVNADEATQSIFDHDIFKKMMTMRTTTNMKEKRLLQGQEDEEDNGFEIDLENGIIYLPDISGGDVSLTNTVCSNVNIGDISLPYNQNQDWTNTIISATMLVDDVEMTCVGNYVIAYTVPFIGTTTDTGSVTMTITDTRFEFDPVLTSENYDQYPPNSFEITNCETNVYISTFDFQPDNNSLLSWVLELLESTLASLFASLIESVACDEINNLEEPINDSVETIAEELEPYLDIGYEPIDPLLAEQALLSTLSNDISLVDYNSLFSDFDTSFFNLIIMVI